MILSIESTLKGVCLGTDNDRSKIQVDIVCQNYGFAFIAITAVDLIRKCLQFFSSGDSSKIFVLVFRTRGRNFL